MNNEMYLIHGEDYISHIDDKVHLYGMMKHICHMVSKLPVNDCTKELKQMSARFDETTEEIFRRWGIPKSYLIFGDENDLAELMENELIAPEDAGFCDCECCCDCCDEDDSPDDEEEIDDEEAFAAMVEVLTDVVHQLFGDAVSIQINVK